MKDKYFFKIRKKVNLKPLKKMINKINKIQKLYEEKNNER